MKNTIIVLLFLILCNITQASEACHIKSYSEILKMNKILDDTIVKESSCTEKITEAFISLVSNATGKLSSQYLKMHFENEFNKTVILEPSLIKVRQLDQFIFESLALDNSMSVKRSTSMFGKASLNLESAKFIKVSCSNCDTPGEKNIKLTIRKKVHWLTTQLYIKRKAYVVSSQIGSLSSVLNKKMFKEIYITDKGSHFLFSDMKNISFYKLNQSLTVGSVVKKNVLTPRLLVRAGQKVKLIIDNKKIKLSTSAIAHKNGRIGDYIDVINPKSKKKTIAKIIDFNTAVIEI